jgi:cytochrome c553
LSVETDTEKSPANALLLPAETRGRWVLTAAASLLIGFAAVMSVDAADASLDDAADSDVPAWAFPLNAAETSTPAPFDSARLLHLRNSKAAFTEAELHDLFAAPDWYPTSHSAMPPIVAHGRAPEAFACGYCHSPSGQGRPENASLAGLPAAYILNQVTDFKSGARKSAWRGSYLPSVLMIHSVTYTTDEELSAAAEYFAAQSLRPRVVVVERERVPRSRVVGWVYVADPSGKVEPLGQRLLEFAPDPIRHENRDDEMRYIAYVPPGSTSRGKHIAQAGADSPANACTSCHGPQLRGVGPIPSIAGRSPTYILRQLLAFQTGARSGVDALPMLAVVKNLSIASMIDAAAYAASLQP